MMHIIRYRYEELLVTKILEFANESHLHGFPHFDFAEKWVTIVPTNSQIPLALAVLSLLHGL